MFPSGVSAGNLLGDVHDRDFERPVLDVSFIDGPSIVKEAATEDSPALSRAVRTGL
jgi:hypothetical protein